MISGFHSRITGICEAFIADFIYSKLSKPET